MLSLQILNDLNIPLCIIGNLSFSKAANVIPTSRLKLRVRGYQCRELNISLSLTPNVVDLFNEVNIIQFETFSDLVKYFLEIQPSREIKPFSVFLANNCLVPELLFTITSVTQTFQSDINGDVKELSISMTLSGTKCSKKSFVEPVVLYDDTTTIPSITIHNNNKEIKCQDSISISDFRLTPTTCNLELIISDSFKEKSDNAWLFDITQSNNSFIEVENYGNFYIESAKFLDSILTIESSIFNRNEREIITKSIQDSTLQNVILNMNGNINFSQKDALRNVNISNYIISGNTQETIAELQASLGFLVCYRDNSITLYEVPNSLYNSNALPFPVTQDISSSKTCKVIYRDSVHSYEVGDISGNEIIVNSPVCTDTDRCKNLLNYYNLMENEISVVVPYDNRIRHHSIIALIKDERYIYCIVTNYNIDIISNTMVLNLNYIER